MAARSAARFLSRRLSTSGKVLSEEEKAAENVYIKRAEKEKLEKLARQGAKAGEQPPSAKGAPEAEVKGASASSSTTEVSTAKNKNYAVLAGVVALLGGVGWYVKSTSKKSHEVQS